MTTVRSGLFAALLLSAFTARQSTQLEPPQHDLVEELRIVSNESSQATSLTTISGLTVLSDGSVVTVHGEGVDWRHGRYGHVGDGTTPELLLRLYDSNGRFVRTIGAKGTGPGEFRSMAQAGSVGDDVWVTDYYTNRHTILSREGRFVNAQRVESSRLLALLPRNGLRFVRSVFVDESAPWDPVLGRPQDSVVYSVEDTSGARVTAVAAIKSSQYKRFMTIAATRRIVFDQKLAGSEIPLVAPGSAYFGVVSDANQWGGRPGQVRIYLGGPDGSIRMQEVSLPPRRVPSNYIDSSVTSSYPTDPAIRTQVRDVVTRELFVPEYYPVLGAALLGRDGVLWIQPMYEADVWRVVVDGRSAMRIRVPSGTQLMAVSREKAWGVRKDANGVPMVVRYRITPSPR